MPVSRVFPVFSVVFATVYLISMYFHPIFTFLTYVPRLGEWRLGVPALGAQGPGMYWWSWLITALVGGVIGAAIAYVMPENIKAKTWSGWVYVIPLVLFVILAYVERTWFGFA